MVLLAYAERRGALFGAANRALIERLFGAILPLSLLGASSRILEPLRLDVAATAIARFGASRRQVALGAILATMAALALFAAAAAAAAAWVAHDPSAPPRVLDAATCAWIGALAGISYAALFAFGATFGARGGGRFVVLVLDLIMGDAAFSAVSLAAPSAHAQNLLGGAAPLGITQPASAVALLLLAIGFSFAALRRCDP
jgi:hypothetical protein